MIPLSTTITDEGRRIRRALGWVALGVLLLNVVVWVAGRIGSEGASSGPDGSSFVTTPRGSAAVAGTLERLGVSVQQLRSPLDEVDPPASATIVVIEVGDRAYQAAEIETLHNFLQAGGRLVVVGRNVLLDTLLPDVGRWRSVGVSSASWVDGALNGVSGQVSLSGFGSITPVEAETPFLVGPDGTAVGVVREVGSGEVVWLADSYPFTNEGLRRSGPSVVAMIGPDGPVLFDEFRHGYTVGGGVWQTIPSRWRTALVLAGAVTLIGLVGYGRRLGPPFDIERRMAPGRQRYLEAVSGLLQRSGDRAVVAESLRTEVRERLNARGAGKDLAEVADTAGLLPSERDAILGEGDEELQLLALDRALAKLHR